MGVKTGKCEVCGKRTSKTCTVLDRIAFWCRCGEVQKPKVFWFHYNKPESLRQKKNILTVHQSGVCHLVTDIVCNVPIHTAHRSSQPRCVLKGKGVVRVVEGVATIDAK